MLRYAICDLTGATVADCEDVQAGDNVTIPLNGRISGTIVLSFDDPAAKECVPLVRVVKCWLDGQIVACGPILKPSFDMVARQVTVPFFGDPSYRLEKSFVNNRGDTNFNTGSGILGTLVDGQSTLTGVDQAQILWQLILHAAETPEEAAAGVPHLGISQGTLESGGIVRDRTYDTGAQIWQQMLDMTGVIDGIDLSLTPVDRTDGTLAKLDTFYPARGTDKQAEVVFECGLGLDNAANIVFEPAGDVMANRVTYQGVFTQGDPPLIYQSNQAESELVYGIYQSFVGRSDVLESETLRQLAQDDCAAHAFPPDGFTITPALDDGTGRVLDRETGQVTRLDGRFAQPPKIGPKDLWVGDTVGVRAFDRPTVEFEGAGRIYEITLTGDADGAVIPTLSTTPQTILVAVT
jgi:hypothetical protein